MNQRLAMAPEHTYEIIAAMRAVFPIRHTCAAILIAAAAASAQRGGGPQSELVRQGQQLIREGKLDEALATYRQELQRTPNSPQALNAAGTVLDLMGKGAEARTYFQKAIETAATAAAKAQAHRAMAMSYGFDGDCQNTARYEQMVIDYWATVPDFYQQGEMANEAARVCIDSGDLNAAEKWYKAGRDMGIKEPDIAPGRKALWEFRTEHALARIAARRGNKAEAQKHVDAAKAALDDIKSKDANLATQQAQFFPYLTGYVAYYLGDYNKALADLQEASANDPFIQCLLGMTYEKLDQKDKAIQAYRKAMASTAHNPPAAFARPLARKKLGELPSN
jgi:tetratricopeptide (TPR) repeat protein